MHNYGVFQAIRKREHFWSEKKLVDLVLWIDGFSDPYDADMAREQIEKEHPDLEFVTEEIEPDWDDEYWEDDE